MDVTTFLISRLQKLLSIHEIDWAEAECITKSFGVMVQWLDSYSLCYCRLVLWLPGEKTVLKFCATARCQADHHKQCVNLRKTCIFLRYWDLFPANPNLRPKGKAPFRLQCCTTNGTSLATCRDCSCGLVSFRRCCFFLKEGDKSEMYKSCKWQKVFKSFVPQPREDRQGVAFLSQNQLCYFPNMSEGPRCTASKWMNFGCLAVVSWLSDYTVKCIQQVKTNVHFQFIYLLLGQEFVSVLLPHSFCILVAALDTVWLIEKTGLILIYRQPLRVFESKCFFLKSWHHVTKEL